MNVYPRLYACLIIAPASTGDFRDTDPFETESSFSAPSTDRNTPPGNPSANPQADASPCSTGGDSSLVLSILALVMAMQSAVIFLVVLLVVCACNKKTRLSGSAKGSKPPFQSVNVAIGEKEEAYKLDKKL